MFGTSDPARLARERLDSSLPLARSRGAIFAALGRGIDAVRGPVLLFGEAGAGKSWLMRRWIVEDRARTWIAVELAPGMRPVEVLHLLAHRIGLSARALDATSLRLQIHAALQEWAWEGRSLALAVDELHLARASVLEELRLLGDLGPDAGGFQGIVFVARTGFLHAMRSRRGAGFAARFEAALHVPPLDADEAALLLRARWPERDWPMEVVERLHRDAQGNAARLWALASNAVVEAAPSRRKTRLDRPRRNGTHRPHAAATKTSPPQAAPAPPEAVAAEARSAAADSLTKPPVAWLPAKPPLRVADDFIEVGWDAEHGGDEDPSASAADESASIEASVPFFAEGERVVESIDDPYAALQALMEEERAMRGEILRTQPGDVGRGVDTPAGHDGANDLGPRGLAQVWPESPHPFEPFGNLFDAG